MNKNVISGKILLKETGVGIPDLLVVLHDLDPGTSPEESLPGVASEPRLAASSSGPGLGDRLGSRLTDAHGTFEFTLDDEEFRIRNVDERQPDLLLLVVAPEEPGVDEKSRLLFTSGEIRQNAGRTEQYVIRIPGAVLKKAGIPIPIDPALAKEEPQRAIGKMTQAVDDQLKLEVETKKIAARQVSAVRKQAQETDAVVESRLVESLTGMTAAEAERFNVVMPGKQAEPVVWRTFNSAIDNVINVKPPLAGYIVLSQEDAARFRDSNGNYRTDIPAAEIEPHLYNSGGDTNRPAFLLRTDPAATACRASSTSDDPFDDAPADAGSTPSGTPPSGDGGSLPDPPDDTPVTSQDLPKFIGKLLNGVIAPEQASIFTSQGRPDSDDVQSSVQSLQLKSGPADVAAFYDFHQLQIAFDYVWQQAIDEGIIETGKALCRELIEKGGDPLPALSEGVDPIKALRDEVRHVNAAQVSLNAAGASYRMAQTDPTAPSSPRPPITYPPFVDNASASYVPDKLEPMRAREPHQLLDDLNDMLSERYKFEVFAPGSANFGLLVTYRQRWQPVTYQVGELVKTLTLAPKETRKVTTKQTVKRERSVKEMEANQRTRKDETSDTMRDEAEIVQKAQNKTNFNLTAKGSYDIGISSGDSTTSFTRDAESSSSEVKKAFREAVLKAAQEFKDERKIEVETKDAYETEMTDSSEITNPNDELTVTYLFYELQRRYLVSESIHRLTPVVLVAMAVPNPNRKAIDKVLLSHSWIINRVLLDDRYRAPLNYLCTRIVGDELALRELAANVAKVGQVVDAMKEMHREITGTLYARELALQRAIESRANKVSGENTEGWGEKAWESVFGSGDGEDLEAARIREDAAKEAYERSVREEKDLRMRLDAETASLNAATEIYAKAYAEHANRLLEIAGLRVHFKENVLYYMQAIWNYTFQDQIFFSLCNVKVPRLTAAQKTYNLGVPAQLPLGLAMRPGQVVLEVYAEVQLESDLNPNDDFVTLAEIADLDNPLGYKGNYMIFPMKQSNALTDFMMIPYIDSELGLHDPDDLASWTPEDFARYARCLLKKLKAELSEAEYAELQGQLKEQYRRIVSSPRLTNDEVIVPTGSLYIEALPGAHPLLEDFKLAHRVIDVKKAQAEARKLELENLRYAARVLGNELEDPEIDKKVVITGPADRVVIPTDE